MSGMRRHLLWVLPFLALAAAVIAFLLPGKPKDVAFEDAIAPGTGKHAWQIRAQRRAYDGAPPVIPHQFFGMACQQCHNERGVDVPGVGFAPPSPHEHTSRSGAMQRCTQCHVFRNTEAVFVANGFAGLRQDLRPGSRLHAFAPPRIPHLILLRENCQACHTGPAAREEIRCSHPDRARCTQCHVPVSRDGEFKRQATGTAPAASVLAGRDQLPWNKR